MVLIYIRHCRDQSENSSTFGHDAKITKQGVKECRKFTLSLIEKYGIPKAIVTSPFLRARQTTEIMRKIIKRLKGRVKIIIDPSLGRFFTHDQRGNPQIRPETATYNPLVEKCPHQMLRRIKNHLAKAIEKEYHRKSEVIWCISHGVIIKKLVEMAGQKAPEEVGFLESFIIRKDLTVSSLVKVSVKH